MKHKRLAALLSLLLAFLLVPSRAYADARFGFVGLLDGVQCHNDYNGFENFLVFAPDNYAAAVMAVGGDVNSLTAEQKLKLSDSNYGGAFYDYAQTFHEMQGTTFPEFVPTYIVAALMIYYSPIPNGLSYVAPDSEFYYSIVSPEIYTAAKAAYQAVINGEDTGGGSSGGTDVSGSFPSSITLDSPFGVYADSSSWSNFKDVSGVQYMRFSNPSNIGSYLSSKGLNYFYVFNAPFHIRGGTKGESSCELFYASASPIEFDFVVASGSIPYITFKASSQSPIWFSNKNRYGFSSFSHVLSGTCTWPYDDLGLNNVGTSHTFTGARRNGSYMEYITYCNSNGVGLVLPPSGDWPSDSGAPAPVAPVVPDPDPEPSISGTVVVAPSVTWPDIDITVNDNSPEGTTSEDYTPWLRAINENLNSLRGDLLTEFDSLQTSIRNIYTYLQHLDDLLENHCTHLRNQIITSTNHLESYLQALFDWLGQQLDFSFDDTDLIIWLKRIYSRLGSGDTYKPNPINDDDGFLDWLYELWQNFLIDLLSVLPDSLGGLVETISQLTHYFPFSIPWDLAALLALFEHEPVIPVFDIPFPYASGDGGQVMLHIDLTDWDPVAQMVRPVFVVGFCTQLALITKDLLSGLDMSKGGI